MKDPVSIEFAKTPIDLEQILHLQKVNHVKQLTDSEKSANGFVTVRHTIELLNQMNDAAPQIIAKSNGEVIGYALVMLKEFNALIPTLVPMFKIFGQLTYNDKSLPEYNYYVMGQICIADQYRGQGIFDQLYAKHKKAYSSKFDLCLTEVSSSNKRSMKAHERIGFKTIYTFRDATDEWNILLWDWNGLHQD